MFRSWRLLLFPFVLLIVGTPVLGEDQAAQQKVPEEILERISFPKDSCWVIVPVEIKGKHYRFVLDTGTPYTTYTKRLWPLLGETIHQTKIGINESTTVNYFAPPDARLGKLKLPRDFAVPGIDLAHMKDESDKEIDGILGMDFLKSHIFRIDFHRGEAVFLRSTGADLGNRLKVSLSENKPQIEICFPGLKEPEPFLLDTGWARGSNSSGCLSKVTFDSLRKRGRISSISPTPGLVITGWSLSRGGWLESLSVAGFRHEKMWFIESDLNLLGLELLSRYVVTFDFPHETIFLKKGTRR